MTFQTPLYSVNSEGVPPFFEGFVYTKKIQRKKSTTQDASVSYKKACLFLARSANEKSTKHRRCFPFGTFAHVQTSEEKKKHRRCFPFWKVCTQCKK